MNERLFRFDDPADYTRVRDVFRGVGYTDEGIVTLFGFDSLTRYGPKRLPALLRRSAGGTPLETFVRLFILGVSVDLAAARRAVEPMTPERWADVGLLEIDGAKVRAAVQIRCYQDLLVACDFSSAARGGLRSDYVMGISPSTLTLSSLTIRRPIRSALDIGTGSGFLAFMAARHAERVVATDKSPRAVAMAEFTARFNQLDRVECRQGDLFAPVKGESFDLIVSNPPFIISPDNLYLFLHSGLRGDELCQRLAREAPPLMTEGGFCQFMADWVVKKGEDWQGRLATWFAGNGCDVFVLRRGVAPVDQYATGWIETEGDDLVEFAGFFEKWMDYYEELGIEAIGSGLITMRRRNAAQNWFAVEEAPKTMSFPCGDDIDQAFATQDFLQTHDDEALLDARVRVAPGVRLEQEYDAATDGWRAVSHVLRRHHGLHHAGTIDPHGVELLARCDGDRTIRELLLEIANDTGTELASVVPSGMAIFRQLLEQRFVLPVAE